MSEESFHKTPQFYRLLTVKTYLKMHMMEHLAGNTELKYHEKALGPQIEQ